MVYTMQYNSKSLKYPPFPLFRLHFPSLAPFSSPSLDLLVPWMSWVYIIHLRPLIIYRTNCLNRKQSTTHQYCHAIIVLSEKKKHPFHFLFTRCIPNNSRNWKKIKKNADISHCFSVCLWHKNKAHFTFSIYLTSLLSSLLFSVFISLCVFFYISMCYFVFVQ